MLARTYLAWFRHRPDSMEQITALLASLFGSVAYPALLMSQCARQVGDALALGHRRHEAQA